MYFDTSFDPIDQEASPNDMPLSVQRTDIIGAFNFFFGGGGICIITVTAFTFFGQSDQMRCPKNSELNVLLKIVIKVCQ